MSLPQYTIAVTGLNAIDSPGPGLAVIKALREATSFTVRIVGLAYESMEPGIYLRDYVDKTYQVPYPSAGSEVLMERLRYIQEQEQVDVLFPNFDAELFNYIKLADRLRQDLKIRTVLPTAKQFEDRQKINLFAFGEEHGVPVPTTMPAYSLTESQSVAAQLGYPAVVKGQFYDAKVAATPEQVAQAFSRLAAEWGTPVLLQRFVKGTEVNVCGIGDGKGETLGAVPMKKLYVTEKGKAWSGVTLDDAHLLELTRRVVKATEWRGPFELEFMKTEEGEYNLLEINPRFPAWCYLTVGAGQNQIEKMVHLALGEAVTPFTNYEVGKMFIRYATDMVIDLKAFEMISTAGEY